MANNNEKKLNGTVIVTYRCNARCSMCNRYKAPSKPEEEISIETIKKLPKMFGKRVVVTIHGIDWQREKWKSGFASKFIRYGEKNAVKYADEIIVLSKGVQNYFKNTYGRETRFIPNGVNRPEIREAELVTEKFGLTKDSYILFLGRLVPEKGIRYLIEAFKNVKTNKKLVIAGGSSDTDSFTKELKNLAKGDDTVQYILSLEV